MGTSSMVRRVAAGTILAVIAVGAPDLAAVAEAGTGDEYVIQDLGTLGGATSVAVAMNESGWVVGSSQTADGATHAFVWSFGLPMRDLGPGTAVDINNRGQVVGNDGSHVFLWDERSGRTDLGALGGASSTATDLNDFGQVAGYFTVGSSTHAFLWNPAAALVDLGATTGGVVLNNVGQVAGMGAPLEGFFWDPGTGRVAFESTIVGEGVSDFSFNVTGINDRGSVVGQAPDAFIWDAQDGMRLAVAEGQLSSGATDVNNRGQVVGVVQLMDLDLDHGFLWSASSGMVDLNVTPSWATGRATAVSESGRVVGEAATNETSGQQRAFVWQAGSGTVYLGTLGGETSTTVDVNNSGWVAGNAEYAVGASRAVVWWRHTHVVAWGDTSAGQSDAPASLADKTVTTVAAGVAHSLALTAEGTVVAWGGNSSGQSTVPASLAGKTVVAISAGRAHSLALTSDGTVIAWGDNTFGQGSVPASVTSTTVMAIAAGEDHNLAVTTAGTVIAWGKDDWRQTEVPAELAGQPVTTVAAGYVHSMALTAKGVIVEWGAQWESGEDNPGSAPGFTAIEGSLEHSFALDSRGMVISWGGSLALDEGARNLRDQGVSGLMAVAAGEDHALVLTAAGDVVGWGDDDKGQTDVPEGLSEVTAIAAGGDHSLAVRTSVPSEPVELVVVSVVASADAYVNQAYPGTNYGLVSRLFSRKPSPALVSYLRFDVPVAPAGTRLVGAVLRVRTSTDTTAGSVGAHVVAFAMGQWSEAGITYGNRPQVSGTVVGTLPAGSVRDTSYDVVLDVAAVAGQLGGARTLALTSATTTDVLTVWSGERSRVEQRPTLVLTFEPVPVEPVTVTLSPSADAYVNQSYPRTNYGSDSRLFSRKPTPAVVSYLRFDLPAAPAGTHLVGASLQVRTTTDAAAGSDGAHLVTFATGDWSEVGVTYANRPAVGATAVGTLAPGSVPNTSYEVALDVTAVAGQLGGARTLALTSTTTSNAVIVWSRERSTEAQRPHLVLHFAPNP